MHSRVGLWRSFVVGVCTLVATSVLLSVAGAATPRSGASSTAPVSSETVGTGAERAVITRDAYGVPTITAAKLPGVWFGAGWAQAEDRLVQLELVRRTVEGTLSAFAGTSYLSQDEDVRTFFYTPAELEAQFDALPAAYRADLVEFSAGINAYTAQIYSSAAERKAHVPYEFYVLGALLGTPGPYRPAPWAPTDTVAVGDYLAREFGGGGGSELSNLAFLRYLRSEFAARHDAHPERDAMAVFNDARWIDDPTAPTTVPSGVPGPKVTGRAAAAEDRAIEQGEAHSLAVLTSVPNDALEAAAAALRRDRSTILRTGISLKVLSHGGSDAFVVAPSRSKDHHALLWGAPQEGFGTPSVDGEEYLHGPGYDAGGMDITGEPFILIGRNAEIGWTTTSEETVDQRVYVEQIRGPQSAPSYFFGGKWVKMTVIDEQIPVLGQKPAEFTVYRTADGPVFSVDWKAHTAFSMRFASWGKEGGTLLGFAQLGGDRNLAQFRHSMSLIATLHNFLYADRAGNIAFFGDGLVPIEPPATVLDPRLPALGNGTEQWLGYVPFSEMPHSVNPTQGYLDNWNTKPSAAAYYQQNSGDEYWGTIFRSSLISKMLAATHRADVAYLEKIEFAIGTIDNGDNTRPAAPYFIPYFVTAYHDLVLDHSSLVAPGTHPDLAAAVSDLADWNDVSTLGSSAMSIFMNSLEALERNVCEGGTFPHERYVGAIDFSDAGLKLGTYGGLGNMCTYNFLYHALDHTAGMVPCGTLCYAPDYFAGRRDELLVESLNDAIKILSGTGTQLGQDVPGFGTADVAKWGYRPALDTDWDSLDPAAVGVTTHCGTSPSQNRSTFMMALDLGPTITGHDVLPPGQSGFISDAKVPSPYFCDQVSLFDHFRYKAMPNS